MWIEFGVISEVSRHVASGFRRNGEVAECYAQAVAPLSMSSALQDGSVMDGHMATPGDYYWRSWRFSVAECVLAFGFTVPGLVGVLNESEFDTLWLVGIGVWSVVLIGFAAFCVFTLAAIAKRLAQIQQQQ